MKKLTDQQLNYFARHIKLYGHFAKEFLEFNPAHEYDSSDFVGMSRKLSSKGIEKTLDLINKHDFLKNAFNL